MRELIIKGTEKIAALLMIIGLITLIIFTIGAGITTGAKVCVVGIFIALTLMLIGFALIPIIMFSSIAFDNNKNK